MPRGILKRPGNQTRPKHSRGEKTKTIQCCMGTEVQQGVQQLLWGQHGHEEGRGDFVSVAFEQSFVRRKGRGGVATIKVISRDGPDMAPMGYGWS